MAWLVLDLLVIQAPKFQKDHTIPTPQWVIISYGVRYNLFSFTHLHIHVPVYRDQVALVLHTPL